MTTPATNNDPNNGTPGAGVSVPAVVPESASATSPAAGSATSAELALVRETLTDAAPVGSSVGVKKDDDRPSGDEDLIAKQFGELDDNYDSEDVVEQESGQLETATPEAPVAAAAPQTPPAVAPAAVPGVPETAPQPAAAQSSVVSQPVTPGDLPPAYPDLFAPVTQSAAAPAQNAPATGAAPEQSQSAAAPVATESDEQKLGRLRNEYMGKLEQSYAFSEEEARAVMLEPEKILPQKFAKMHTEMLEAATAGILQQLPAIVQNTIVAIRGQYELNQSFYRAWPQLAKPEYANTVRGLLHGYRQQNPNANWEQTVREVGATALVALKLPLSPEMLATQAQTAPMRQAPVAPANPGGGAPLRKPQSDNPFEALNDDWDHSEALPDS